MLDEFRALSLIVDTNTDQQDRGLMAWVQYDRKTASRFGISSQLIDSTLYDAFGQALVSTMYTSLNQYYVVMEVAPPFWQSPAGLNDVYIHGSGNTIVPLSSISRYASDTTALAVNHQGQYPSV